MAYRSHLQQEAKHKSLQLRKQDSVMSTPPSALIVQTNSPEWEEKTVTATYSRTPRENEDCYVSMTVQCIQRTQQLPHDYATISQEYNNPRLHVFPQITACITDNLKFTYLNLKFI